MSTSTSRRIEFAINGLLAGAILLGGAAAYMAIAEVHSRIEILYGILQLSSKDHAAIEEKIAVLERRVRSGEDRIERAIERATEAVILVDRLKLESFARTHTARPDRPL